LRILWAIRSSTGFVMHSGCTGSEHPWDGRFIEDTKLCARFNSGQSRCACAWRHLSAKSNAHLSLVGSFCEGRLTVQHSPLYTFRSSAASAGTISFHVPSRKIELCLGAKTTFSLWPMHPACTTLVCRAQPLIPRLHQAHSNFEFKINII
jgi:hypothetical protein